MRSIKVLQGETRNEFSQVFYQYAHAKLRNRRYLPKDFYQALERHHYFIKMEKFLRRRPRIEMTQGQRLASDRLGYELGFIWSVAFNETILSRMVSKYPGFHRLSENLVPVELDLERRGHRRNLISEVSRAIWRNDKNWEKVEQGFTRLQESYLRMLASLDIPESVRNDWSKRISEVRLVLPGAFPAISNEECSTTTINAYYYTYLNVLTICAGDFNSEDIIQTLAHEMGHALGIDRSQYIFQIKSDFGKGLSLLRKQTCEPKAFTCESWYEYKRQFTTSLESLVGYQPDLPEFQRCLKRRETSKTIAQEDIDRFAKSIVLDRISGLASTDRFLRITKSEIPMINGRKQKNPNYFNPCSYYLWTQGEEPIDDELTTMMYFTAEYRCSEAPLSERMKNAIEVAKNMSIEIFKRTLKIEGEYSSRSLMETEGYSSPPYERFADVIGSYAMAELLSKLPLQWDRQNKFLASSSWQCLRPSLASHFPDESAIEKEYIFDAHTEGDQRRKELFSTPLREAIGCDKDFEFKECSLPFRGKIEIDFPF
ncbi:MAG: hypothetical protein IPJ71_11295 [Bdellovibrionales bacterium]|nr:hypothetical protein [Bdellovibrionales bacterium]